MTLKPLFKSDLDEILNFTIEDFLQMKNSNIFITGATGFFGKWLIQSLLFANNELNLNLSIYILTRQKNEASLTQPWLNNQSIHIIEGDVRSFNFPKNLNFEFIIHAATEASAKLNENSPVTMADVIIQGTKRVLELANLSTNPRFLFISSGAVYGKIPPNSLGASETLETGPDISNINNAYAEAKRMAELYCQFEAKSGKIQLSIARCFAFVGPYLPLDTHFAIGNFINDKINNREITMKGDGTPVRTYMYPTNLIEWLVKILIHSNNGEIFNVGSDEQITISQLKCLILDSGNIHQIVAMTPNFYAPNISKAKKSLNISPLINLKNSIERTIKWIEHE